jgi:hypothetical protein
MKNSMLEIPLQERVTILRTFLMSYLNFN